MIRIDMSEYTESHSVARLIGAPPGINKIFIGLSFFIIEFRRLCGF